MADRLYRSQILVPVFAGGKDDATGTGGPP